MKNLELYIHIPFCVKKCDYCDFLSFPADLRTQVQYVHAMLEEIRFFGTRLSDYLVSTIYVGGGTPSWLDEELLATLLRQVYSSFAVAEDAECTIECNPGTVTAGKLRVYAQSGINRLSIGLQSANEEELKCLGRIHTYEHFLKTYELARKAEFSNINVDLMSGIPYQKAEVFADTLQKVIRLKPKHISAYSLIVEKGTPFYERYKFDAVRQEAGISTQALPNEEECYRIYKLTQRVLEKAGYERYEISNYAKPGYACRHNTGYWTRENYLGLGIGAASMIENIRFANTRDIYAYIENCKHLEALTEEDYSAVAMSRKEQMEEFMFLGLRMTRGVSRAEFEESFGVPPEAVYRDVMENLKEQELLIAAEGRICLTDRGLDLANYCMAKFLL
ncbi:MAG: oxygen-independent coproporphyrinogen III oxidase [Agathobacter sp.]|nr:oxygen-independent coproporphyrinogen III oxidase [Agathobacter sp.]